LHDALTHLGACARSQDAGTWWATKLNASLAADLVKLQEKSTAMGASIKAAIDAAPKS
jgi:hypothetical protein